MGNALLTTTTADEMFRLRKNAWQNHGVLSLRRDDAKLTPSERAIVNAIGERLYNDEPDQREV